ncbi:dolichyl-diphosphooligosaccharide-protein glycosyltransferase subunit 1 [Coleophoma cylindrospora]|uniref:Dolichyl-diphosphooligosaccharide--protein glycosyltransferase subunit 1 n=1 Tax=Coleophoma cylindrospora TaxID=1849047 RepID=A0A3D8SFX2_9HELO|nr:dolichyl-diphosphooligosaccharide-protein glycosyltransferase subunit 1 [Coleophoma cylindrospora]
MRSFALASVFLSLVSTAVCADESNLTKPLSSKFLLPSAFKPPQVFKNTNLVHVVNLEKSYPKESINVVIENTASSPQDEYYLPFTTRQMETIGALEVKDRKAPESGLFEVEAAEIDPESDTQYYRIRLPKPLAPKAQQTLGITYHFLSALDPLPATIQQKENQYLVYTFSAYCPSAYVTLKQKTEVKFPTTNVREHTVIPGTGKEPQSPQIQGTKYTYGSFGEVPAGAYEPVRVRYEFTKPLIHVSRLERDIEVSHWGGNLAFEERYTMTNRAANLSSGFSRTQFAQDAYYNPQSPAIKELKFPLRVGSLTPYFTDVIGNVSTSRFRSNKREANLELKPRYPVYGGWNYPFRVGWDADLKKFLRKLTTGDGYVLNAPFLEGPKQPEGVEYELVELRVILPEGATNVKYSTTVPVVSESITMHKTFMDTIGRTTLTLTSINVVDDLRDREIIVTYDYPFMAGLRKPLVIFSGVMSLFVAAWAIGSLDVAIKARSS